MGGDAESSVIEIRAVSFDDGVVDVRSAPTIDQFRVWIENTRGEVLRRWDNIDAVPPQIRIAPGSYRIVAACGDTAMLPSFDHIYYQGEVKFSVKAGDVLDTTILAQLGVTKVGVSFDKQSFEDSYSDYSADIRTTTPKNPDTRMLNFRQGDTDVANFLPGTLRIRMRLTSKADGKEYVFMPDPIMGVKAREVRSLKLAVKTVNGKANLHVTTDGGYDTTMQIELKLPASILPKPAPVLRPTGFDVSANIEANESFRPQERLGVMISAQGGIKKVLVRTESDEIKALWGGLSEINIVDATTDMRNRLNRAGFKWGDEIATSERAERCYGRTEINLEGMYEMLRAKAGQTSTLFPFEIEVVDMFDQSNKDVNGYGKFRFVFEQRPPIFALQHALTEGNVWARRAEIPITYTANVAGREPYVEVSRAGGPWTRTEQRFEQTEDGVGVQRVEELDPETEYSFRVKMGDHMLPAYTATTEREQGIDNGNMERWKAEQLGTTNHNVPYYWPYADGDTPYWTTNNDRTTAYRSYNVQGFGFTYGYNCFPAVSYSLSANSGKFAAEIRTTSASDINALNTTSVTQKHSQVAGLLYIGDFSYSKPDDHKTYGKPFASRADSMCFHYTYASYNNDSFDAEVLVYSGGEQIGRGYFASATGVSASSYEKQWVRIIYSVREKRADSFSIIFRSTTKGQPEVKKQDPYLINFIGQEDYNKDWALWVGSVLRVDDISVAY